MAHNYKCFTCLSPTGNHYTNYKFWNDSEINTGWCNIYANGWSTSPLGVKILPNINIWKCKDFLSPNDTKPDWNNSSSRLPTLHFYWMMAWQRKCINDNKHPYTTHLFPFLLSLCVLIEWWLGWFFLAEQSNRKCQYLWSRALLNPATDDAPQWVLKIAVLLFYILQCNTATDTTNQ